MFSRELYEISKKTFSYRTPPVVASIDWNVALKLDEQMLTTQLNLSLTKLIGY